MSESGRNNEWRGLVSGWGEWVKGIRNRWEWKKNLKVSGEYDKVCKFFLTYQISRLSMTFSMTFSSF